MPQPDTPKRPPKTAILIFSIILAGILVGGLIPTPNVVGGGGAKMVLMIFLTVAFKAAIEYFWGRKTRKKDADKPVARMSWRGKIAGIFAGVMKFIFSMLILTVLCTGAWDAFLNGKIYCCTDGGALDYLNPGDWVHGHNGYPVVVVPQIVPPHGMSDPDTIKSGWSVTKLWCVWVFMFGGSLIASAIFAYVPWLASFGRLAESRRAKNHPA